MKNKHQIGAAVTLTAALLATGCSSFSRDWKTAMKQPVPGQSIEGPWEGTWKSDSSQHSDKLRLLLTKLDGKTYEAKFHAKYRKVFTFGYTVNLTTDQQGTNYVFSGEANLGKLAGGLYTYHGTSTPSLFLSTYDSKYDKGTFELKRPQP